MTDYKDARHLWENREALDKYLQKLKKLMYHRRNRLDLSHPAELAIRKALDEVEKIGADVRLTKAIILLSEARDLVADYIDVNLNPLPNDPE